MPLESVGVRLKRLRQVKGLTRYRLGKISGVAESYIYRIEPDKNGIVRIKHPQEDTLRKLAQGLGIAVAELVGETSPWDTWGLVEQSLKAYIPVYGEIGDTMAPVDYIVTTRTETPPTLRAYRIEGLYLEPEVLPGDTIIVDTTLAPSDGDLVVVVLEDQPMIKRYIVQEWQEAVAVPIHGVITELQRKLRR